MIASDLDCQHFVRAMKSDSEQSVDKPQSRAQRGVARTFTPFKENLERAENVFLVLKTEYSDPQLFNHDEHKKGWSLVDELSTTSTINLRYYA